MKLKFIIYIQFSIIFFSCKNREQSVESFLNKSNTENVSKNSNKSFYLNKKGDSLVIYPFEIEIILSEKEKNKITNSKETIVASMYFYGYPKDNTKADPEGDGRIYLVGDEKEFSHGKIVRFENLKISKKDYDGLIDKDFELNLNVFTGRKSTDVNLLNCEPIFEKVSSVANKKFTLQGKLIDGDD